MPLAFLLAATALLAPQGGGPSDAKAPAKPRNLLVITLDTTRRDFMGFLGRTPSPTPNLDRLAAKSVVFTDAYTPAPLTLPAHSALFTGRYPRSLGVHENSAYKLPQSARTLAEVLHDRGFATSAVVGAFVLDPMFGLDQGFQSYDAPALGGAGNAMLTQRPAAEVVTQTLSDLARRDGKAPFFCWVHLFDPHFPYRPPGESPPPGFLVDDQANLRQLYEQEIRYADGQIGRLLTQLEREGLLEDLVVLFCADHGESLGDAPEASHGYFLFDPTVRIPMLLRCPGIAPRRVEAQVSLVDVVPTLLDLLGIDEVADPTTRFDGVDLAPLLRDPAVEPPDRALLLEAWYAWINFGWAPFDGCVQGALKLVRSHRLELFDRAANPGEERGLVATDDPRARAMARRLDELVRSTDAPLPRDPILLSGADLDRLAALGYSAAARGDEAPDGATLPDAYEKLAVIRALEDVVAARYAGDRNREVELLRGLVAAEPGSADLRERLGVALVNLGAAHLDEAEEHLRAVLSLQPKASRSHYALGRAAEVRAGLRHEQIRKGREQGQHGDELRDALADEHEQAQRAILSYKACLEFEPHFPDAIERLVRLLREEAERSVRAGAMGEALDGFREVDLLLARWLAFMPASHPDRSKVANNRAWIARRRAELEKRQ